MKRFLVFTIGLFLSFNIISQNVERYMEYHDKGRTLILQAEYEKAILILDTAILTMPYYTTIFQDRGYAFMQLKKYQEAISDFNHVLSKKPYLHEVRLQRGMALYHDNKLAEAEIDILDAINNTPRKSIEAIIYLENIRREKEFILQKYNQEQFDNMRWQIENERITRARHREEVIWGTLVPLAFWTSVFLCW